jgi:hypothetical protein
MKLKSNILIVLLAAAVVIGGGCDRRKNVVVNPVKKPAAEKADWTPQEIAADPEGYITWSQQQVDKQIAKRQGDRQLLADRRAKIEEKRQLLRDNIRDVQNIHDRLEQARQNAEDEDRWPIKIGVWTFDREKAKSVLSQTAQYIKERQPLDETYDQIFAKMNSMDATYGADIDKLRDLRVKLDADLENVRLNKGMAEVEKLRATQSQLASMASAAAASNNDPLKITAPKEPPGKVNIDDMLK